ncbi:hypothetical protein F5Y04DRAFT_243158 [Hypomontagnella monticulosa]|nr:hypothetical protein F5Y04DRAFT_243158 [Hypomontagnella monticulosa]
MLPIYIPACPCSLCSSWNFGNQVSSGKLQNLEQHYTKKSLAGNIMPGQGHHHHCGGPRYIGPPHPHPHDRFNQGIYPFSPPRPGPYFNPGPYPAPGPYGMPRPMSMPNPYCGPGVGMAPPGNYTPPRPHRREPPVVNFVVVEQPHHPTPRRARTPSLVVEPSTSTAGTPRQQRRQQPGGPNGGRLYTETEIWDRGAGDMAAVKHAIQKIVALEFSVPTRRLPRVEFQLTAADLDSDGEWQSGEGRLWDATQASIWTPTIVVKMPEDWHAGEHHSHSNQLIRDGPDASDLRFQACAIAVMDALRDGTNLDRYRPYVDLSGIPLDQRKEVSHCTFEFRIGNTRTCRIMSPDAHVYLPTSARRSPLYERHTKNGPGAESHLRSWAARWNIKI